MLLRQSIDNVLGPFNNPSFTSPHWIFCGRAVSRIVSMARQFPFVPQDKLVVRVMFFAGLNQEHLGKLGKRHRWLATWSPLILVVCGITCSIPTPLPSASVLPTTALVRTLYSPLAIHEQESGPLRLKAWLTFYRAIVSRFSQGEVWLDRHARPPA